MKALRRIVLHVGPEKCGSTTIQGALGMDPATPGLMADQVRGVLLDPYALVFLESDSPAENVVADLHGLIAAHGRDDSDRLLVLSHEMIFKSLALLAVLTDIAKAHADDVMALAYVRRQSDLLVSGFGQWHFRSPDRLAEASSHLRANGLDADLFRPVERHVMAAILGGWQVGRQPSGHLYFDWSQSLPERVALLAGRGARMSVGVVPQNAGSAALVPDALTRIGVKPHAGQGADDRRNPAFHPYVIEAVADAITAGFPMPGPHEANGFLRDLSAHEAAPPPQTGFLDRLKAHVDGCFADGNARVADDHGLPGDWARPAQVIDRAAILKDMAETAARRAADRDTLAARRHLRARVAARAWSDFRCAPG